MQEPKDVVAERIVRDLLGTANNSNAHINVHAGGVGVWVCATACVVMLVTFLVMLALFVEQSRKVDDLGHQLSAVYMLAPHLKPSEATP